MAVSRIISPRQFSGAGFNGAEGLPDMSHPRAQRLAAGNIAHMYDTAPKHIQETGRLWYPKVHEATAKGARQMGMSIDHAAGLVAAVSPNMDWEKSNIGAFKELHTLKPEQWDAVHRSAAAPGGRSREAKSALRGLSISSAPDSNLVKAHRIMGGEHPDDVLNLRTAPKTNSFFHNIADPSNPHHVTVDGRHNDIATNTLRPWKTGRGIGSAGLKRGTSRYEHFANATKNAAQAVGVEPSTMQAVSWEHGRHLERTGLTKAGTPRKVGVRRTGQGYTSLLGGR